MDTLEGSSETGQCAPRERSSRPIGQPIDTAFYACNPEKASEDLDDESRRNARVIHALPFCFRLVCDLAMPLTKAALLITYVFDVLRTQ